jgi:hypothetical protein
MNTCSICLDEIKEQHLQYKLSCNHIFHFTCFKNYVLKTKHIFFIDCPNCRELNYTINYPFPNDFKKNIKAICSYYVGKERCPCITKQGLKCKKKSHLLNYGYCQFHGSDIIPKDKYKLLCTYLYHLLQCSNRTWETKIYLLDFTKKLLIKYPENIHTLEDIYKYIYIYIADAKKKNIENCYKDKSILYNYYELELPPEKWIKFCVDKRCLF